MAEPSDQTAPSMPSSRPEPSSSRLAEQVSFDDWARQSGPRLLRFAQVVTGRNDAADAVQDALVAVFARWRRLSRAGTPDGYARRVIVNRHISRWRRWGRREQLAEKVEPASDPADVAAAVSDAALARQVLAELSPRQRAAVVLRFYDDLAYSEIADILDCTDSTARSYVRRALIRLRELLPDERRIRSDD